MKTRTQEPCIYVIELTHGDESWIKVGMAVDRICRFGGLQCGSPIDYSRIYFALVKTHEMMAFAEATAHVSLADRAHRGEWFIGRADGETLATIAKACAEHSIEIKWDEYSKTTLSRKSAASRSVSKLNREVERMDMRREEMERIDRESARAPLSMTDVSRVYGSSRLGLKLT